MGRTYATPEQLTAWTGSPAPSDADRLLARASEDIDDALLTAVYEMDAAGMPTEPPIVAALADATCAQVEYQRATGDDGTGAAALWDSVTLGPASFSGRREPRHGAGDVDLAPRAARALTRAGLLPGVIT
ncbi:MULTISPECIES: hypothetical protein [Streptomyces]|uniref:hypothetical protein n=1 Tax=Streptomyces TaxID=1883 RepID=UPI000C276B6B|nr:hypothetical protein [Streptomyces sp. CB02120-2]PJN19271.1 hypothetical protein CG724_11005 [Streptomyces sp. CB02120-2]